MADEPDSLKSVAELIPSLYYDLIARICAGVPFLALLLSAQKDSMNRLVPDSVVGLILLLGAGYVVGFLLTPLSLAWNAIIMPLSWFLLRVPGLDWRHTKLNEEIALKGPEAALNLTKMQAEATMCQNLLSGYVFLFMADWKMGFSVPMLHDHGLLFAYTMPLLLGVCAVFQTMAYIRRQKMLYSIFFPHS